MNETTRAYIYRVALALLALAVAYGLISGEEQVAAWTALITAVAGNGLAVLNTNRRP